MYIKRAVEELPRQKKREKTFVVDSMSAHISPLLLLLYMQSTYTKPRHRAPERSSCSTSMAHYTRIPMAIASTSFPAYFPSCTNTWAYQGPLQQRPSGDHSLTNIIRVHVGFEQQVTPSITSTTGGISVMV